MIRMSRTLSTRPRGRGRRPPSRPDNAIKALRLAKRVIEAERREQMRFFVVDPIVDFSPESDVYPGMHPAERRAIRRFDRTIRTINEALDGLSGRD